MSPRPKALQYGSWRVEVATGRMFFLMMGWGPALPFRPSLLARMARARAVRLMPVGFTVLFEVASSGEFAVTSSTPVVIRVNGLTPGST